MNRRNPFLFLLLPLMPILLMGCSHVRQSATAKGQSPVLPTRIVSLTPSNTEILFALGLEDKVVGDTTMCNYPPEAQKKPHIGDMNVNIEKVISLNPDLVLAHKTLNRKQTNRLESLGIKVIAVDPKTISEVISDIGRIGKAVGDAGGAEELAQSMRNKIAKVKEQAKNRQKPKVLMVVQTGPLWAAGPDTFADEMIAFAGGENIANDAVPGFNMFSSETAFSRNPYVIIVTLQKDKSFFEDSPVWKKTKAVQNRKVVLIDPDLLYRPGPRLVQGLEKLSEALR